MLSLAPALPYFAFPPILLDSASAELSSFVFFPRPRKPGSFMGVVAIQRGRNFCGVSGFVRRCRKEEGAELEMDSALETEILEFMKGSRTPDRFPSKKQLLEAGRRDLVEAISQRGGWFSFGWDVDSEEWKSYCPYDVGFGDNLADGNQGIDAEATSSNRRNANLNMETYSSESSRSGVSSESSSGSDSGIEGILNRLEKERNSTFGIALRAKDNHLFSADDVTNGTFQGAPTDEAVAVCEGRINSESLVSCEAISSGSASSISRAGTFADVGLGNTNQPLTWRTWSIRRAGLNENDFEAAEIDPPGNRAEADGDGDFSRDDKIETREKDGGQGYIRKDSSLFLSEISSDEIRKRIQHLEMELSSALQSVRSKSMGDEEKMNPVAASEDQQEISDAWEFQESEIMNAQDKLRSIRAKLAVQEGKITMAIIEYQKTVEQKQKRIDETRRALRHLRKACIVWPNSASEVLVSGSFDGWRTKRKMEKSSSGIFSISLMLYPGRHEIKFIVDGVWKIDPLRPIVGHHGYENNLLVVT